MPTRPSPAGHRRGNYCVRTLPKTLQEAQVAPSASIASIDYAALQGPHSGSGTATLAATSAGALSDPVTLHRVQSHPDSFWAAPEPAPRSSSHASVHAPHACALRGGHRSDLRARPRESSGQPAAQASLAWRRLRAGSARRKLRRE
eukprot:scaffold3700_cov387-Prasinococcus_capsulatus_cf.AAC.10